MVHREVIYIGRIVLSGWGGVTHQSSNDLIYLESVPYDWLLPKCKLLIHHGGAEVISFGLRAGFQTCCAFHCRSIFLGGRELTLPAQDKNQSL
jgi:sterol 3beta-glucosyltransferase